MLNWKKKWKFNSLRQQMPQRWEDLLRQNALAWELSTLKKWSTNATGMGIGTLRIDQATKMEASSYLHRSISGLFFVLAKIRHFLFYYNGNNGNGCTCTRPVLSSSWSRKLTKTAIPYIEICTRCISWCSLTTFTKRNKIFMHYIILRNEMTL